MQLRQFTIIDGHPATGEGWVYAWVWPDGVRYVGATWLDPAVRAEAHLHLPTDDPRSLALRNAMAAASTPPRVVADSTPTPADRQPHKRALIDRLRRDGLLAADVIDPGAPAAAPGADGPLSDAPEVDAAWLDGFVQAIRGAL